MRKIQKQFNPPGIKWLTEVDMPLNKTQTQINFQINLFDRYMGP